MSHYLLQNDSIIDPRSGKPERVCTADPKWEEWYPPEAGWVLLHHGPDAYPQEHADWDDTAKKWKVDPERKAKAERRAAMRVMDRDELIDLVFGEIDQRVDKAVAAKLKGRGIK